MQQKIKFDIDKARTLQQQYNIKDSTFRGWKYNGLMPNPETYHANRYDKSKARPETQKAILEKLDKNWIALRSLSTPKQLIFDVKANKVTMSSRQAQKLNRNIDSIKKTLTAFAAIKDGKTLKAIIRDKKIKHFTLFHANRAALSRFGVNGNIYDDEFDEMSRTAKLEAEQM